MVIRATSGIFSLKLMPLGAVSINSQEDTAIQTDTSALIERVGAHSIAVGQIGDICAAQLAGGVT